MLITGSALATAGGLVWKYWRVPWRLLHWHGRDREAEPLTGHVWREAGLSPKHQDWKVTRVTDEWIEVQSLTGKDDFGDFLEERMSWEEWAAFLKKRRLYIHDRNDTIDDLYWGDAAD